MSNTKVLCLNMIVKNEMANLERCLSSVADHIDCWVIGDTGSTDGTQDFIRSFFAARKIPGELHSFPFLNFEQARNAGLDCAYGSKLAYDYLLFDDADMELVVEDRDFRSKLTAPSYTVLQRSGISYWNTRLVRRSVGARYRGVTHEYVDVPGGGGQQLQGIWYKDHASGSNRVDKFERDIRLLKEGLEKEPESTRYWFYLAQSYRDAGQTEKAAETYAKRAAMGGWDEEAWYARLQQARCLRKLGDEGGFVREALAAFNQRPQRAEPLHDLAKYYREKGSNDASVLFAESGLAIERPNDILFLEDFVYTAGLKEEYSIAANYSRDPVRKDRGHAACNWLALSRTAPEGTRNLARSNLYFYVESAATMMPSFSPRQVTFTPPDGYRASNPSITRRDDEILMVQRCVNYTVSEDARHYHTPNNEPIQTRNFLLRLSDGLETRSSTEILLPADMPEPSFKAVLGFEDMRLFAWRNELWTCSTIREQNPEGYCEQVLARLEDKEPGPYRLSNWRVLRPNAPRRHEKNWMPHVVGEALQFMYLCDPTHVIDGQARTVSETTPPIMGGDFRGGSQLIEFDGGWLTLIHEVIFRDGARVYLHRFVWFDKEDSLKRVSRLFFFQKKGIEFAAGLAWHPDGNRLIASYGVGDGESWMATIDADDVRKILDDTERLPWGGPKPNSERKVTEVPHLSIAPAISPLGTDVDHGDVGEANLSAIFTRSGTDKVINGYAGLYEALFSKGRREIRRVLEIGIGTMIPGAPSSMVGFAPEGYKPGASLRAWREFFPNATIYGADIQPDTQFSDEERIVTVLCNSSDADQVKQLMSKLNNEQFDIIIDDGSHILENQLKTLRNLYPFLKSGGFYIVEDCGHNGLAKQADAIREICGDIAFFGAGPYENPLVLTKRPDGRLAENDDAARAASLAWHPDGSRLIASYGVGDGESRTATIDAVDVQKILGDAERLPWGGPKPNSDKEIAEVSQLSIAPVTLSARASAPLKHGRDLLRKQTPSLSISCYTTRDHAKLVRAVESTVACIRVDCLYWFSNSPYPGTLPSVEIINVPIPKITDLFDDLSRLHLRLMPRVVETDFNLIVHPDGFAVNRQAWDDAFWEYDYIGAPWTWMWGGGPYWRGPIVGNGGFSLRSRKLYRALLDIDPKWRSEDWASDPRIERREYYVADAQGRKCLPEDVLISLWYRQQLETQFAIKFCPPELANKFCVETVEPFTQYWLGRSFGFHGVAAAPHYGVTL